MCRWSIFLIALYSIGSIQLAWAIEPEWYAVKEGDATETYLSIIDADRKAAKINAAETFADEVELKFEVGDGKKVKIELTGVKRSLKDLIHGPPFAPEVKAELDKQKVKETDIRKAYVSRFLAGEIQRTDNDSKPPVYNIKTQSEGKPSCRYVSKLEHYTVGISGGGLALAQEKVFEIKVVKGNKLEGCKDEPAMCVANAECSAAYEAERESDKRSVLIPLIQQTNLVCLAKKNEKGEYGCPSADECQADAKASFVEKIKPENIDDKNTLRGKSNLPKDYGDNGGTLKRKDGSVFREHRD